MPSALYYLRHLQRRWPRPLSHAPLATPLRKPNTNQSQLGGRPFPARKLLSPLLALQMDTTGIPMDAAPCCFQYTLSASAVFTMKESPYFKAVSNSAIRNKQFNCKANPTWCIVKVCKGWQSQRFGASRDQLKSLEDEFSFSRSAWRKFLQWSSNHSYHIQGRAVSVKSSQGATGKAVEQITVMHRYARGTYL